MANIKNIIFDLGNVIVDLDIPRTRHEMSRLMRHADRLPDIFNEMERSIEVYEVGNISDELFINAMIKHAHPHVYAQQVIKAWNAMLIDIPLERLEFAHSLRSMGYNTYVLSNTNNIHLEWVNRFLERNYNEPSLDKWFDKVYYSHIIQKRKPNLDCFEYVINEMTLDPDETLFIDDNFDNITGAKNAGLKTIYLTEGHDVISSLRTYLGL